MEILRQILAKIFHRALPAGIATPFSIEPEVRLRKTVRIREIKKRTIRRKEVSCDLEKMTRDGVAKEKPIGPNETRELFRKLTRGRVAEGVKWGVFDDSEEGKCSGLIATVVAVDEPYNNWSIRANELENGDINGWMWIIRFKLSGELEHVGRMATDQGRTKDPINWKITSPPTPYFPGSDLDKMKEAMDVTHSLLTALRAKIGLNEPPLSSKDKEYGLIL